MSSRSTVFLGTDTRCTQEHNPERQCCNQWRLTLQRSFSPFAKKVAKVTPSDLSRTIWGYRSEQENICTARWRR